jgi:hypothetical protein
MPVRLRTSVFRSRWGGRATRVLTPARALRRTSLYSPTDFGWGQLVASRADLLRLGAWARLAAVSPHSALYVPCRPNQARFTGWQDPPPARLDLVVARIDGGLKPSDWKRIRAGLRAPQPATLQAPLPRPAEDGQPWQWPNHRRLKLSEQAATLMLIGPTQALFALGDLLTEAGEQIAVDRNVHRHGQAYLTGLTHLLRTVPGRLEFDIIGDDPLFHRSRWAKIRRGRWYRRAARSDRSGTGSPPR